MFVLVPLGKVVVGPTDPRPATTVAKSVKVLHLAWTRVVYTVAAVRAAERRMLDLQSL
jgi:hypothetical protein